MKVLLTILTFTFASGFFLGCDEKAGSDGSAAPASAETPDDVTDNEEAGSPEVSLAITEDTVVVGEGGAIGFGWEVSGADAASIVSYLSGISSAADCASFLIETEGVEKTAQFSVAETGTLYLCVSGKDAAGVSYNASNNGVPVQVEGAEEVDLVHVLPVALSFSDSDDDKGEIGGNLSITKGANEASIDSYEVFFGDSDKAIVGDANAPIANLPKTGANLSHSVAANTALPATAEYFLVYTRNSAGQSPTNLAIAIVDRYLPTAPSGGLAFTDTDTDGGQIAGNLTITKAANETDLESYTLYWGSSATDKLGGINAAPLATLAKTGADIVHPIPSDTAIPAGTTHLLVYAKNQHGELPTVAALLIVDAGLPSLTAQSMTFVDNDLDGGQVSGNVNIVKATDESEITHYALYWGSNATTKHGAKIASIGKTGGNVSHTFGANTAKPGPATHLLVFSENANGEMATGINVAIADKALPTQAAAGIAFVDTDLDGGQIAGNVTITKAANESNLTHYMLYYGSNATTKQGGAIATLAKSGGNVTHSFASNTAIPGGATHLLVFTSNAIGEMATGVNLAIADKAIPTAAAVSIAFTDTDGDASQLAGTVTITKAGNESSLAHYSLYWGSNATTKLGAKIADVVKTGGNPTHSIAANTAIPATATHFLVFSGNGDGEMATGISFAFADLTPPTLSITEPAGANDEVEIGSNFLITFNAADADSDATISLFYKDNSTTGCSGTPTSGGWTAITGAGALSEDSDNDFTWDTTGLPVGNYYICGMISDGLTSVYATSSDGVEVKAPILGGIRQIVTGTSHSCALLGDYTVKCWGKATAGQLGQSNTVSYGSAADTMGNDLPTIELGAKAVHIAVNSDTSCAVLDDGNVKCWGLNTSGQLGKGDTTARGGNPGDMAALTTIDLDGAKAREIHLGNGFACALLRDGIVKCWGGNSGRFGSGTSAFAGNAPGQMGAALVATSLGAGAKVRSLNIGTSHSCAVIGNDVMGPQSLKCWGINAQGRLGLGHGSTMGATAGTSGDNLAAVNLGTDRFPRSVSAGDAHTCAILDDGNLKCWGNNANGQLGLGHTNNLGDGAGEMGDTLSAVDLGTNAGTDLKAVKVAAGASHTCALLNDSSIKCWGLNTSGQLGLGDTTERGSAGGEMGDALPAVNLGTDRFAIDVVAGANHTCALLDDTSVKCWGSNTDGVLGYGDTAHRGDAGSEMGDNLLTVDLKGGQMVRKVVIGGNHSCALISSGDLKCWGRNNGGQLGYGNTTNKGNAGGMGASLAPVNLGVGVKALDVALGYEHSCAILSDHSVKCWGNNDNGQLGLGHTNNIGDGGGEMGAALVAVDLGDDRFALQVSAGQNHTCALLDNSDVKCWGSNTYGNLGLGDTDHRGDNGAEMGNALPAIDFGLDHLSRDLKAVSIQSMRRHTCAMLNNSKTKCWGRGTYGTLGVGSVTNAGDVAGTMGDNLSVLNFGIKQPIALYGNSYGTHTCAILDDGAAHCWGHGELGKLGLEHTNNIGDNEGIGATAPNLGSGMTARHMAAGYQHTCAVTDSRQLKCWGYNTSGALGLGDTTNRGGTGGSMGDNLAFVELGTGLKVMDVVAGSWFSCALLDNGRIKCWGESGFGQLGLGSTADRGDQAGEMGDDLPMVELW